MILWVLEALVKSYVRVIRGDRIPILKMLLSLKVLAHIANLWLLAVIAHSYLQGHKWTAATRSDKKHEMKCDVCVHVDNNI